MKQKKANTEVVAWKGAIVSPSVHPASGLRITPPHFPTLRFHNDGGWRQQSLPR